MGEVAADNNEDNKRERSQSTTDESLGAWDSFALVTNNTTGPGMMGLPLLFHNAGIIPTSAAIFFIGCCSGLCGTMLAETLSLIPGNSKFDKQIEFSSAFRLIIGGRWYKLSEALLMIMCMVQAISGLVETAQSLDSFFASFILDDTIAIAFTPLPSLVTWSAKHCTLDVG
jgi:amino acid permease